MLFFAKKNLPIKGASKRGNYTLSIRFPCYLGFIHKNETINKSYLVLQYFNHFIELTLNHLKTYEYIH